MASTIIYKYPINVPPNGVLCIPMSRDGLEVLRLGPDPTGQQCIWVEHDDDWVPSRPTIHHIYFEAAGFEFDPRIAVNYLGSYVDGKYVWHLYSPTLRRKR